MLSVHRGRALSACNHSQTLFSLAATTLYIGTYTTFFSSNHSSSNQLPTGVMSTTFLTVRVSASRLPPLRHIKPLGKALRCSREIFLFTIFIKSGKGNTARLTTKSYSPRSSSPAFCSAVALVKPMAVAISCVTRIFFAVRSISLKRHSGNTIANGMPGKPPPVPKSSTRVPWPASEVRGAGTSCRCLFAKPHLFVRSMCGIVRPVALAVQAAWRLVR